MSVLDAGSRRIETEKKAALAEGVVTREMLFDQLFTQRELRIAGWTENPETGDWHKDAADVPVKVYEPIQVSASTDVAVVDDQRRALELTHGERYLHAPNQIGRYSSGPGRHHKPAYDDYEIAKMCIHQALGDMTDIEIWGTGVLCAVFCRPNITSGGIHLPVKEIKEDWWQHKAVLVIKCGPDAFQGDESYLRAKFGDKPPPAPGDWLFARPEAGLQTNFQGTGGTRPQGRDAMGRLMDLFEWDGWPCRTINHDDFIGRLSNPQAVV